MKFKIILASDPKLPFRVCVAPLPELCSAPQPPVVASCLTAPLSDGARSVNVPEAAPFTAVIKYVADEVRRWFGRATPSLVAQCR